MILMRKFTYWPRSGLFHAVFLLLSLSVFAQTTGTIKGTVKDASGQPLSGASVTLEGQKGGTITDVNGNYTLKAAAGAHTLLVSFVGQSTQRFQVTVSAGATVQQNVDLNQVTGLTDIVIVGSRSLVPRSKLTTPVPVDVISSREIKQFAQTDISQLLTYVAPSFQSARQTISDGTDHIDPAGLRGLGPDQTLVLVNGKRRHTTALVNINGTVGRGSVGTDLNTIPAAAIERIEVLRDGAAAQYGSDAIAGVINIVLKKNYKGFTISGLLGENVTSMPYNGGTSIEDGFTRQIDFSAGHGWSDRTFINVSGQWLRRDQSNRSGLDNIPLIYLGNGGNFPVNRDSLGATSATSTSAYSPEGVSATDYRRWLLDEDGKIVNNRQYDRHNIVAGNSASENWGLFVNAGLALGKKIAYYGTRGSTYRTGFASGFSRNPNSWNQQAVKANGQRFYFDGFLPRIHTTLVDLSTIDGFKFDLGEWTLDVSNTYGRNSLEYTIKNTGNASLPATDNIQTEFDAGKLTFIQNTINADLVRSFKFNAQRSVSLAMGGEFRLERFRIAPGERNSYINGGRQFSPDPIVPYPGTGRYFMYASGTAVSGSQVFPGFQPADSVRAKRSIYAVYVDVEFRTSKLLLGAAARFENYHELDEDYSNLGGKLTARYDITGQVAIRGSINTGFRAPSLHQRYFQNTSTQFTGGLPSQSLTANNYNPIVREAFAIKDLKPEKSISYTAGVVGNISRSFTVTVDAYYIRIDDRIVLSTPFNRNNPLVDTILKKYGADASISALQFWTNAVNTETKGIDIVATKRFRLGNANASISVAGNFNRNDVVGNLQTNSVIDDPRNNPSKTTPGANPANDLSTTLFDRQQRSRIEVAQPRSKINITLLYEPRNWSMLVRTVRFGEITYLHNLDPYSVNPTNGAYFNDVGLGTDQTFDAKWATDVVVTYRGVRGLTIAVGANNVFDVYPDRIFIDPRNDRAAVYANPVPGANKTAGGYNAARDASNRGRFLFPANQFGFNGRFLFARLTVDAADLIKAGKRVLIKK
jgi:iron complex outermembrane receptor protein